LAKTPLKIRTVFTVWSDQVETAFDVLESDVTAKITLMRAQGIADAEIFARLSASLNDGMDMFGSFKGKLEKLTDELTSNAAQTTSNNYDPEEVLVWVLDPEAIEHCGDCLRNADSEAKTWAEWEAIGIPGMGNTECGNYCKCTLDKA
jgi:hypothetical protein